MDINELVVSSLKNHHGYEGPIWTIENTDKYAANAYSADPGQIRAWLDAARRATAICASPSACRCGWRSMDRPC